MQLKMLLITMMTEKMEDEGDRRMIFFNFFYVANKKDKNHLGRATLLGNDRRGQFVFLQCLQGTRLRRR
jgi:hypothetical protein